MTTIVKCTCKSEYQDKTYGAGNRVANSCVTDGKTYRCTVCGKEHGAAGHAADRKQR